MSTRRSYSDKDNSDVLLAPSGGYPLPAVGDDVQIRPNSFPPFKALLNMGAPFHVVEAVGHTVEDARAAVLEKSRAFAARRAAEATGALASEALDAFYGDSDEGAGVCV